MGRPGNLEGASASEGNPKGNRPGPQGLGRNPIPGKADASAEARPRTVGAGSDAGPHSRLGARACAELRYTGAREVRCPRLDRPQHRRFAVGLQHPDPRLWSHDLRRCGAEPGRLRRARPARREVHARRSVPGAQGRDRNRCIRGAAEAVRRGRRLVVRVFGSAGPLFRGPIAPSFEVTVESASGRRRTDRYLGYSGHRLKVLDRLGRIRTKRG